MFNNSLTFGIPFLQFSVVKPKDVKFSDAAAVVGDAVNSYTALHYLGRICAGETILVTGVKVKHLQRGSC